MRVDQDGCIVRTARKQHRCACAKRVLRYEATLHCQHGHATTVWRSIAAARAWLADPSGGPCHGLERPTNPRTELREVVNPEFRADCARYIAPGERYVEYVGEAAPYQSGTRYCARCAEAVWGVAVGGAL